MAFSQAELIINFFFCDTKLEVVESLKRPVCIIKTSHIHIMNVAIISVAQYLSIGYSQNIYGFNLSIISYYNIVILLRAQATLGRLENLPGHSGIRTSDLWNTSSPPSKNLSACPVWLTLGVASQYHNIIFTRVEHHH